MRLLPRMEIYDDAYAVHIVAAVAVAVDVAGVALLILIVVPSWLN